MELGTSKTALRQRVRSRRAQRPATEVASLSQSANAHLAELLDDLSPRSVAVFLSRATEPQTRGLIDHLRNGGVTVWAPHSLDGGILHWSKVEANTPPVEGPQGVPEPESPIEDRSDRIDPDVVICPAALVDRRGNRLGWGKGYYDRFLATLGAHTRVIALVFDDEVVDDLPQEEHDIPVTDIATPSGVRNVAADS